MSEPISNNFIHNFIDKDLEEGVYKEVYTRFPPEPNGYLHIGHAKAICVNFTTALKYKGKCNLRYDDTNPVKEDVEYVDAIEEDIKWLGFSWDKLLWASSYFETMYDAAVALIKKGKAFVDELTAEQIKEYRGTLKEPGKESPYRNRSVEENLALFEDMRDGKFADGEKVLRAKINMASPNINMRDPVIYRILHAHHHNTGDKWCIYPTLLILLRMRSRESRTPFVHLSMKTTDRYTTGFWMRLDSGKIPLVRLSLQGLT